MNAVFQSALLVEDEPNLAQTLKIALRKMGILPSHASTLGEARALIEESAPELIVLDRQLPDGEGLDLCGELRRQGYRGCILVLTAFGQMQDRVAGLNAGADDYLPKPFSWEELDARIRALARRRDFSAQPVQSPQPEISAQHTLWQRDENRLRIYGPNGWVELTPLEFKLATHLILASGNIVSRDELLKEVWGFSLLPKTRTVDHFLSRLRKHFEGNPEDPRHFLTIRGAGYRFQD